MHKHLLTGFVALVLGFLAASSYQVLAQTGVGTLPPVKQVGNNIVPRTSGAVIGSSTVDMQSRTSTSTTICLGSDCRSAWPVAGNGTTTIFAVGTSTGPAFTFANGTETNLGIAISCSGATCTWTPVWIGQLDISSRTNLGGTSPIVISGDNVTCPDCISTTTGNWLGTFDGQEGAFYLARANHTGTQTASTISDFSTVARGLFSATLPLTYNSGTGAFAIPKASSTADGYLSSADWTAFNAKLSAAITSLNGSTSSTQTFAISTSGQSFTITTSNGTHTFNFPVRLNDINGLATTTGNVICGSGTTWGVKTVGTNGKALTASSTAPCGISWETVASGGGTPGGSDKQVQFNDAGTFGGQAGFEFDKTTGTLIFDSNANFASIGFADGATPWAYLFGYGPSQLALQDGVGTFSAVLDVSQISASDKTFAFPNQSGTFCLTTTCLLASNNLSDLPSTSTARTNLGLGTLATINSPVPYANGGTATTTAFTQGSLIFAGSAGFAQNNSNLFFDNTNVRLAIGTTTPASKFQITDDGGSQPLNVQVYYNNANGALTRAYKARGSAAAPRRAQSGDTLAGINAFGATAADDSTNAVFPSNANAQFRFLAAENFLSTSTGTHFTLTTTPIGSATSAERLRVTSEGNVGIGTTTPARALHISDTLRLEPRASAPTSASSGDMYVDSTPAADELCFYDGAAWQGISSGTDANCT
jgi:hypothetical protein